MACSKYTLTNTSSSSINFNYRRCDDSLWEYQVELLPNQTKNIWSIDETYSISPSFLNSVSFVDNGPFPPILPTVTPTPTVTSTNTPTPTVTSTQTPTPTNVLRSIVIINCHSEISQQLACDCQQPATLFVNNTTLANSTLAWADEFGPNTGPPIGYYVENSIVYYLNGDCSIGCVTGSTIESVGVCDPTPTPTSTPTITPTNTETPTPTPTETPTPTPTPTTP